LVAVLLVPPLVGSAAADTIADFYRGKTVTFTVGYPSASGYTCDGQILARYLGEHTPCSSPRWRRPVSVGRLVVVRLFSHSKDMIVRAAAAERNN